MILSPQKAIEEHWVSGPKGSYMIQPNGIDFNISKVFVPDESQTFWLKKSGKKHRDLKELEPYKLSDSVGTVQWRLLPRSSYDFMSDVTVKVPRGVAATLVIRSTASRGMLIMSSGVFDSGFEGNLGACVHNLSAGSAVIEQGAMIGQVVFYAAQNAGSYSGSYQGIEGHWANSK